LEHFSFGNRQIRREETSKVRSTTRRVRSTTRRKR
jgi:hypothetical protein